MIRLSDKVQKVPTFLIQYKCSKETSNSEKLKVTGYSDSKEIKAVNELEAVNKLLDELQKSIYKLVEIDDIAPIDVGNFTNSNMGVIRNPIADEVVLPQQYSPNDDFLAQLNRMLE